MGRLDPVVQTRMLSAWGNALKGVLHPYWRFRVGDFRIICDIQARQITILMIAIGHRREIYDR